MWSRTGLTLAEDAGKQKKPCLATIAQAFTKLPPQISDWVRVQAVIRTLQTDERQRTCLLEERVLKGDLAYGSSMPRLTADEERSVPLAMPEEPDPGPSLDDARTERV